MSKDAPTPMLISAREARSKGLVVAVAVMGLYLFAILTLYPPLSRTITIIYGLLSLVLALIYAWGTPYLIRLPEKYGPVSLLPIAIFGAILLLAISLIIWGRVQIYFFIFFLLGYSLPIYYFGKRIWSLTFLAIMVVFSWLCYGLVSGWETATMELVGDVPWLALMIALAEGIIQRADRRDRTVTLAAELKEAHHQLQEYAFQAEELAVTRERARLSHEIHDTVGHTLTALDVQLELLSRLPSDQATQREEAAKKARALVKAGLTDVRRAVQALQPNALENFSVSEAITNLVNDFKERKSAALAYQIKGEVVPLASGLSLLLYRAVQEALTNIQRHTPQAEQVLVELVFQDSEVKLVVENDRLAPIENINQDEGGQGLRGLKKRTEIMGGQFWAGPNNAGRFRVLIKLPYEQLQSCHASDLEIP